MGYSGELSGRNKEQATGIWRNGDPGRKAKDFTEFSSSSSVLQEAEFASNETEIQLGKLIFHCGGFEAVIQ